MFKKTLALLLAVSLLSALPVCARAEDTVEPAAEAPANPNSCTPEHPCAYSPTIIVPGINQSDTALYVNGEETGLRGGTVFPDGSKAGFGALAPVFLSLLASLLLQNDIGLSKSLYNLMGKLFWPQQVDKEGRHVQDLRTDIIGRVSEMTESQKHTALNVFVPAHAVLDIIGEDHMFFFAFNLVGEVWGNVDELEKYIDYVRAVTGHEKVNLVNVSLGGTLFTGYLERYGHKKLDQVINVVSTTDGTPMMADLMTFNLTGDPAFWYNEFFPTVMKTDIKAVPGYDAALGYLIGDILRLLPHKTAERALKSAWQGILDTVILNCTQFWAMVPRGRYQQAADQCLAGEEYRVLRAKTDSFHEAQLHLEKNVLAAVADGVHINNIAGAGLRFGDVEYTFFQPVASRAMNSDGIIATEGATMGAACAPAGEALPAGYTPKQAGYLSPDGSIDCSTAILPDNTWVFTNQHHEVGRNDAVLNLVAAFYANPGMTVQTDPKNYPQYNHAMTTNSLRRWRIADAKKLLDEGDVGAEDRALLEKAIAEGEAVRKLTVGDAARAKAATDALDALLVKYGRMNPPKEDTRFQKQLESVSAAWSRFLLRIYGERGYLFR